MSVHRIYVASRSELGPMWQRYRAEGAPIISTWIDESGPGESADLSSLWTRCVDEASSATVVVAYHRPGDVWKGAFIEIGAALAGGARVLLVGDPPGSWVAHPLVRRMPSVDAAMSEAICPLLRMEPA